MEKIIIPKEIFSKKVRDYTFAILFLLIFSGFIVFAIRPSITTAFSLRRQEADLSKVDRLYEDKIMDIAAVQTQVEQNRDNLPLLDQAVSENPQVNKMVEDIKNIADNNRFLIKKANIADVDLAGSPTTINNVRLTVEGKTNFSDLMTFFGELSKQRRLKVVDQLLINRDPEASGEAELQVTLTIDGYYL